MCEADVEFNMYYLRFLKNSFESFQETELDRNKKNIKLSNYNLKLIEQRRS